MRPILFWTLLGLMQPLWLLSDASADTADTAIPAAGRVPRSELASAGPPIGGDTVLLTRGSTYRARLKLSFLQCFASRSKIASKLRERGFGDVRLFMSARELPGDWPSAFRRKAGHCERYAEATWTRDTRRQRRPSAIEKVWRMR